MIKLNKTITRELELVSIRDKGKYRPVILDICPGDILVFHGKKTQRRVEISLNHCMALAEILNANSLYKKALSEYKEGIRKRRPKKAQFPYSKIYFDALK